MTTRWTPKADKRLFDIMMDKIEGGKLVRWTEVAEALQSTKDAKRCRLRWENQLRPDINHRPFDDEETAIVRKMQLEHGNNWAMIGKTLTERAGRKVLRLKRDGAQPLDSITRFRRTENQVKNSCQGPLSGGMARKRRAREEGLAADSSSNDVAMKRQRAQILSEPAFVPKEASFHPGTAGLVQEKTFAKDSPITTDNDKTHLPGGSFPKAMATDDSVCFDMTPLGEVLAIQNTGFHSLAAESAEFMHIDSDWKKSFQVMVHA